MMRRFVALFAMVVGASAPMRPLGRRLEPPPPVPREFRGAWATPIWDRGFRDWPSRAGLTPDAQRAELRTMLDHAAAAGLNAVLLHVRIAGDALYPSAFAPWSGFLSERQGEPAVPEYDPLAYAVSEAHARGLQLHAWFNPFRAVLQTSNASVAPNHVTRTHPDWIRKYGSQTWINPGDPAARKFVLATILDVAKRYEVDGIHLDDYFYPYRESRIVSHRVHGRRIHTRVAIEFPDARTWQRFGRAKGWTDRDAWRRANIDQFVEDLYSGVKAINPAIVVGISPFGIWRPGSPPGVTGLDAFGEIYADSKKWLARGWVDFISPQLYWELGGPQDRFRALDAWWRSVNPRERYVWPALYTSHVYGGRDAWPIGEIREQIATIRAARVGSTDAPGHIHFRLAALFADNNRLAADLATAAYSERAIVPPFAWLGASVPAAPLVAPVRTDSPTSFSITPGDSTRVRWWLIQTRGRDGRWTTTLRPAGDGRFEASAFGTADPDEVAVTAITATGVASVATLIAPAGA